MKLDRAAFSNLLSLETIIQNVQFQWKRLLCVDARPKQQIFFDCSQRHLHLLNWSNGYLLSMPHKEAPAAAGRKHYRTLGGGGRQSAWRRGEKTAGLRLWSPRPKKVPSATILPSAVEDAFLARHTQDHCNENSCADAKRIQLPLIPFLFFPAGASPYPEVRGQRPCC